MRRFIVFVTGLASLAAIGAAAWRRNRRFGTGFVNRVVNPYLLGRRLTGSGRSEIATLEHVERTEGGFRIIAPLGTQSEWARNVIAAGHCRLQLHDVVYELDEPTLISPAEAEGLPALLGRVETRLGFRYLSLRTFAEAPGRLDVGETAPIGEQVVAGATPTVAVEPSAPARRCAPRAPATSTRAPRKRRESPLGAAPLRRAPKDSTRRFSGAASAISREA
jgi:hypothetical protein